MDRQAQLLSKIRLAEDTGQFVFRGAGVAAVGIANHEHLGHVIARMPLEMLQPPNEAPAHAHHPLARPCEHLVHVSPDSPDQS